MVGISLPAVLDVPPVGFMGPGTRLAMARAAERLETVAVATLDEAQGLLAQHRPRLIVRIDPDCPVEGRLEGVRLAELPDSPIVEDRIWRLLAAYPGLVVSVRILLDERAPERAKALVQAGAGILHLQARRDGCGMGVWKDRFLLDLVRAVHLKLVEESTRDEVSLLVSGGIAMAEHMAKTIICGADGVGLDLALAAALECRLCTDCEEQNE